MFAALFHLFSFLRATQGITINIGGLAFIIWFTTTADMNIILAVVLGVAFWVVVALVYGFIIRCVLDALRS